jgi:hypothetical protein
VRVLERIAMGGDERPAFASLDALIDAAEVKREGIVATTFDVAS